MVVNAHVVIFGKVQTDKDDINHCKSRAPNFSMCHKLLQNCVPIEIESMLAFLSTWCNASHQGVPLPEILDYLNT